MTSLTQSPAVGKILVAAYIFLSLLLEARACTTAVISGKATADGRPLLWKNRDSDNLHNQAVYAADGKYAYIGIVNTGDAAGMDIWAGINSEGFAIMNSASYNLEQEIDTNSEGRFMKLALQSCATVGEFQELLERTNPGGRDVNANFGVIDAKGGAAFFEADRRSYRRFDASGDSGPKDGYLIRSNYSDSGIRAIGTGFFRRERATALAGGLVASGRLDAASLLGLVCRDIANEKTGSFPLDGGAKPGQMFAYTGDSICRYDTSSAAVFAGVKAGEDPLLSVAWVILGQPVTGVAVPLWVRSGTVPPEVAASPTPAPLNEAFDAFRDFIYPDPRGEMKRYIDLKAISGGGADLVAEFRKLEEKNFRSAGEAFANWAAKMPAQGDVAAVQAKICAETCGSVVRLLQAKGIKAPKAVSGVVAKP